MNGKIQKPNPHKDLVEGLYKWVKILMPRFGHQGEAIFPREIVITQDSLPIFSIFKLNNKKTLSNRVNLDI